jgi:ATP-dependent helicase/nuclease subunit A
VSDEALLALTAPHSGVLDPAAWDDAPRRALIPPEDRAALDALRDVVLPLRGAIETMGPAEALRLATRALSFEETLVLLTRGEQRVANARKVIALAEGEPNARAFLAHMNRAATDERAEPEAATFSEEEDAVRLLTVHASKGLDFPIVFLPEVGSPARAGRAHPMMVRPGTGDAPSSIAMRAVLDDGLVLDTPSYASARRDAARRDVAERARLAYVAATRAREAMIFVGDTPPPKGGPTETYLRSTAAVLAKLAGEGGTRSPPGLVSLHVDPGYVARSSAPKVDGAVLDPPRTLGVPASRSIDVTATELVDFVLCPRRFQLAHVTRLMEPGPWRWPERAPLPLERRSAYARTIAREAPTIRRGHRFLARASAEGGPTVSVEGCIDLWVEWPGARADALFLDVASSLADPRLDLTAKLAAFAHAARPEVRTGTVRGLERGDDEPRWLGPVDAREMNDRLLAWGASLAEARWLEASCRAPLSTCHAIRCGYVGLCHPENSQEDET